MLFCGGECGLEWYLPAFFSRPVTPTQLNPALVFRTQLQWKSSRRITPLPVASLTHYSPWIWETSRPELVMLPSLEHPLWLNNNCAQRLSPRPSFAVTSKHMHKQALCFPWGMAPLCFYSCVPPSKQACQVSQRAMLATFLEVIMVTLLCDRNVKTFSWAVSKLSW